MAVIEPILHGLDMLHGEGSADCALPYDAAKVEAVIADTRRLEGIYYVRVWLNEGELQLGEDIMFVLIGGDIRPRVVEALQYLVGRIKSECVKEIELN